jgi:inosose dehydratase
MPNTTSRARQGLRFAYSTINWGTRPDLAAVFGEIAAAGWRAVELFDHALDWLGTPQHLAGALDGLRAATSFGVVDVPASGDQLTVHKRRMEYAALFGVEMYGLVGGGRARSGPPNAEEYRALARACEDLAAHGEDLGMGLAYHPHVGCTVETEGEIDVLLSETRQTKLCLDVSHIGLVGEDPVAHLRKYRDRLGYVHLKDWAAGRFVGLGQGTIGLDMAAFLAELERQQFAGWVVVEQSRSDGPPADSAQQNAEYLRGLGYELELPEARTA